MDVMHGPTHAMQKTSRHMCKLLLGDTNKCVPEHMENPLFTC
jgi:hypothetical protein